LRRFQLWPSHNGQTNLFWKVAHIIYHWGLFFKEISTVDILQWPDQLFLKGDTLYIIENSFLRTLCLSLSATYLTESSVPFNDVKGNTVDTIIALHVNMWHTGFTYIEVLFLVLCICLILYLDHHTYNLGLYHMTTQVCPEMTRAIYRCTWTITHTAQGCIILHPMYVWKGPGLYIDVPGLSHIQPRAVHRCTWTLTYTAQGCT
jgi:hypothetical protein